MTTCLNKANSTVEMLMAAPILGAVIDLICSYKPSA